MTFIFSYKKYFPDFKVLFNYNTMVDKITKSDIIESCSVDKE